MNTDKMIPIDFCRNITPYVPGDVYYNNFLKFELTMDQQDADGFNKADPESEFNTYFIVSFAARPNTGKQPVDKFCIVDGRFEAGSFNEMQADYFDWSLDETNPITSWKLNHAALLAKFKEQGANTMFTFENTKEATGWAIKENTNLTRCFYKIDNVDEYHILYSDSDRWSSAIGTPFYKFIELSRPAGERKEDHTDMDGVVTYALKYKLDDNPDEPAPVAESMIGSSEFYQSDNPQIIEPWVGDHITCPGKPVFTQEMSDAGELPPVGVKCEIKLRNNKQSSWEIGSIEVKKGEWVCIDRCESLGVYDLADLYFRPIDNRTDDQKAYDDLYLGGLVGTNISKAKDIIKAIKANKIHGVKWSL